MHKSQIAIVGAIAAVAFLSFEPATPSDQATRAVPSLSAPGNIDSTGSTTDDVASPPTGRAPTTAPPTTRHQTTQTAAPSLTTHKTVAPTHHSNPSTRHTTPSTTERTVGAATTPSTTPPIIVGGSTNGGKYCNGWITRVAAPSHLTVYDTTNGRAPTATDCANAHGFFNTAVSANLKYADINVARANNFRPGGDPPGQYAQHYVNWNPTPGVAAASNPEGLVYHFDAAGNATLIGIYFFERSGPLTQPAGPLTVWHSHTPTSIKMLHVWTFPGVRDPFALMLSGAS